MSVATDLFDANRRLVALDEVGMAFWAGQDLELTDFGFELFKLFAADDKLPLLKTIMNMDTKDVLWNEKRMKEEQPSISIGDLLKNFEALKEAVWLDSTFNFLPHRQLNKKYPGIPENASKTEVEKWCLGAALKAAVKGKV